MKFLAASTVFLATLVAAQNPDPFINTPTGVTTCLTTSLTYGGTHPPFTIIALPGGQASGTPIETIVTNTNDTTFAWLVNLDQGTYITLEIRDSLGNLQYTSPITVIAGTSTSCVGTQPSGSSSGAPSSTSSGPANPTSSSVGVSSSSSVSVASSSSVSSANSVTSSRASTTSAGSTSSVASSSSTSASHTSTSGAASHLDAKFGFAGVLGLLGAAIMV